MKKFSILLSCVVLSFFAMIAANATTYTSAINPTYDEANQIFYANGNKIVINAKTTGTGAIISYTDISGNAQTQEVTEDITIIGGGVAGTHFEKSDITLKSGTVRNIVGGGDGSTTVAANVDTANIKVEGGNLTNLLFGGGRLTSNVKNAYITMTGGTVDYIHGGGHASVGNVGSVGIVTDLANSPCRVENVVINVSGGRIHLEADGYGALFGGGQGFSYTKNATMNISGNVNLSTTYISLGGSNGMTENSTLNIDEKYTGTIQEIQSINRGSMKEATFNINGGTISDFYLGQAAAQNSSTANLPKAYIDGASIKATINGGTITNLYSGYNYKTLIGSNSDLISVISQNGIITNESAAIAALGSSLKIVPKADSTNVVAKEDINAFVGVDFDIVIKGENYTWTFNLKNEEEALAENLNLNIEEIELSDDVLKSEEFENAENVLALDFNHSGLLPAGTTISYTTNFAKGVKLDLYYLNPETEKIELVSEGIVVGANGVVTLELSHCSTYALVQNKPIKKVTNPDTADMISLYIAVGVVSLIGIGAITLKKIQA